MTDPAKAPLPPGSVIGILGGGQLGRMAAQAAAQLGYRCHIFTPERHAPATQVTPLATIAAYDDQAALGAFAEAVDLVSFEFENIPIETVQYLSQRVLLRPRPEILRICQNRLREKDFCREAKVPTTRYGEVASRESLLRVVRDIGCPCILKTVELGYDGKGQVRIDSPADCDAAWDTMMASQPKAEGPIVGIVEAYVDFRLEMSVIVARAVDGSCRTYPPAENQHRHHILDQSIVPARVTEAVAERAEVIARHLAKRLDLVGLLAIEMFVTAEDEVLVNELAPRPHNSGHWTLDACATSQFEQFIRALAGLPLGSTEVLAGAVMKNLLGEDAGRWQEIAADPLAKLHLYGKTEQRPGRKMGHVTRLILKP